MVVGPKTQTWNDSCQSEKEMDKLDILTRIRETIQELDYKINENLKDLIGANHIYIPHDASCF